MSTNRALIGATGFVGGVLRARGEFDGLFHSANIASLPEREWNEVVCAGMPAEKWRANDHPEQDASSLERLWNALGRTSARRLVLISTVDVFDPPRDRDERNPADAAHPYGRHRRELEERSLRRFDDATVVRLPALYGPGLKKNALYDLLHDGRSPAPPKALFQWYDVERLPGDLARTAELGLSVVHLVSEPVPMGQLIDRCFGGADVAQDTPPAHYDLRSRYAEAFGGSNGYLQDRSDALEGLVRFVKRVRTGEVKCASPSR